MDAINAFKYLEAVSEHSPKYRDYMPEFAVRAVAANPDFPEGHLYLARRESNADRAIESYRVIVSHPDVHTSLSPKDTVSAFNSLGYLLSMDQPVEAIKYLKQAYRMDPKYGMYDLSVAYQRLDDPKTAWVYLKKLQGSPHREELDRYVEAVEAGTPLIAPLEQVSVLRGADKSQSDGVGASFPNDTLAVPSPFLDGTEGSEERSAQPPVKQERVATERERAAAAAKHAHADFVKYQELSQKEFDDFLQWAETIMNADAPMDTNDFLMKEMEAHLKGGQPQFAPDRIIRAFETLERYSPAEGIKRLQKNDPDVAA